MGIGINLNNLTQLALLDVTTGESVFIRPEIRPSGGYLVDLQILQDGSIAFCHRGNIFIMDRDFVVQEVFFTKETSRPGCISAFAEIPNGDFMVGGSNQFNTRERCPWMGRVNRSDFMPYAEYLKHINP